MSNLKPINILNVNEDLYQKFDFDQDLSTLQEDAIMHKKARRVKRTKARQSEVNIETTPVAA
jgi:hypothetical protein